MVHAFVFRPGSLDEIVFNIVNTHNEYKLPDAFDPDDIIIDIGMHIGSFCYTALRRGSDYVYGFEADLDNYQYAVTNLQAFGNWVHLFHQAVWRSDRRGDKLFHTGYNFDEDLLNTGGGNVLWANTGEAVETVAFDGMINEVTDNGKKRVRLVKLDCETSEFPILLTSRTPHLIVGICGEYHEVGGERDNNTIPEYARVPGIERFTIAEVTAVLTRAGFLVESFRHSRNLGMFFANGA